MQIVRTIGEAFEVCHRISLQSTEQNEEVIDLKGDVNVKKDKACDDGSDKSLMDVKQPLTQSKSEYQTYLCVYIIKACVCGDDKLKSFSGREYHLLLDTTFQKLNLC